MIDISTSGVGVSVAPAIAQALRDLNVLAVSFHLPGNDVMLKMPGNIHYDRLEGDGVRFGISFDWDNTRGYYRKESAIAKYVAHQQLTAHRMQDMPTPGQGSQETAH